MTNKTPDAQKAINDFKADNQAWIIAVGMISEGTDIPRLRVCCHLSRIRTELHYRQVLGRILRRYNDLDEEAWLFVLAEPSLLQYSERLADDLPNDRSVVTMMASATTIREGSSGNAISDSHGLEVRFPGVAKDLMLTGRQWGSGEKKPENVSELSMYDLNFSDRYRARLLQLS